VNQQKKTGHYTIHWDGKDDNGKMMASGIYLYQLNAGKYNQIRKMLLLR